MAKAVINLQKASGGIVKISPVDGVGVTEVTVPESGELATKEYVHNSIPKGLISMWSGSIATIPTGWALCNGQNGTPNLQDRFVIGAGSGYAVGTTGGSKDAIVVSHTHTGTAASAGAHTHSLVGTRSDGYTYYGASRFYTTSDGGPMSSNNTLKDTGILSAGAHTHSLTIDSTGSSGTNANLPPYYALAYIMKL